MKAIEGPGAIERKDAWWIEWALMATALTVFLIYAMWATLQGKNYLAGPYRSPFYPLDFSPWGISPALLVFWIPVFFRLTCYYWRRVYYRVYLNDPSGCTVGEFRRGYRGETAFPFVLQNLHRYFVYLAVIFLILHWKDSLYSFYYNGKIGIGVGNVILLLDSFLLTLYVFSCHALRHIVGGSINRFWCSQCTRLRYRAWKGISILNYRHGFWAWVSLVGVIIADMYVRLLATGVIEDINTWGAF